MKAVYVYEKHNGCSYDMITECNMETGDIESISMPHKDLLIITDRELSDIDRFCIAHEDWDQLIGVFNSLSEFKSFLAERNLCDNPFYDDWLVRYEEIQKKDYQCEVIRREDFKVGLFFFVDDNFAGSLPSFIAAFASIKKLSKKEIDEAIFKAKRANKFSIKFVDAILYGMINND